jgi:hypothetical protein
MYSTIGHGGNEAGGHTWNMVMRNGTENIVSCTQEGCHAVGSITEFDRPANADFDGDGAIEGVQTEVQGLLDMLAENLPQDDDGDVIGSRMNAEGITEAERIALWNYYLIANDGSLGIHNTQFAVQLLQTTINQLTGQDIGEPAVPATLITHTTEGRDDCSMCHSVGTSGVGEPGGLGMPNSHEGRSIDFCQTCHMPEI